MKPFLQKIAEEIAARYGDDPGKHLRGPAQPEGGTVPAEIPVGKPEKDLLGAADVFGGGFHHRAFGAQDH